jgi:hypothetical protein
MEHHHGLFDMAGGDGGVVNSLNLASSHYEDRGGTGTPKAE